MKRHLLKTFGAAAGIVLASGLGVRADTLYSDSTTQSGYNLLFGNGQEFGQQIWLGTLTPEYLTNFALEYYDPNNTANWNGGQFIQADVKFYLNDGAPTNGYDTPSTLFYDSGLFDVPTPYSVSLTNTATLVFDLSDLTSGVFPLNTFNSLPTNFTFTVTFTNLTGGDQVGLSVYEPPTIGTNYGDYWYDASGTWELLTNAVPIGFGSEFNGSLQATPEPTVLSLGALGAAVATLTAWRRKRRG